ncbi:MAG TPA: hypothetical protein OIM45_04840 [Clostridiaceae bacterium]|nr:hypothetical protein [Clostridiaceae bacterium]
MIGLNNLAKVEGIKEVTEDNLKVRFIAVEDDKTTLMCDSLNNQEFYINKENVFDRYYGETQKELRLQRIRCNGLVLGLNLPPIQHHFHYCRSTIMYLPPVEKQEKTEYNGLASSSLNTIEKHPKPKLLEKIDYNDKKEVLKCLEKYEKTIQNEDIENAIVITKKGEVYQCFGNNNSVWVDYDLKEKLNEAYITHNHPENETQYSFSEDDIALFNNYNLKTLRGIDNKYTYELTRDSEEIDEITISDLIDEESGVHALNINRASRMNIGYRRWKND